MPLPRRVRALAVEMAGDGYPPPQAPPFPGPLAPARPAAARAAPLGRDRPRPGRLRGLLRVRLLPRLVGRPGGRGDGGRLLLPLRRPRLPHPGRAVRRRRPARGPPDDGTGPPVQDRRRLPRRRAPARPGHRVARPRAGRHAARRPRGPLPGDPIPGIPREPAGPPEPEDSEPVVRATHVEAPALDAAERYPDLYGHDEDEPEPQPTDELA